MNVNFEDEREATKKNVVLPNFPKKLIPILIIVWLIFIYFATPILNPIYTVSINFIYISISILIIFLVKSQKKYFIIVIGYILLVFSIFILTTPIFWSSKYYSLIGDVTVTDYAANPPKIDDNLIPVVDEDLAKTLGDKKLGENIGLGSQYTIGNYNLVNTQDDLVWVAPLEPISFIKWLQNNQGSPGYIYVSATNPNDVRLVQDINGENLSIKYTNNSYFNNNIRRHVYLNGNVFTGLTDFSFEIDDEGNPYWVITKYRPSFNIFAGDQVSGILVVDAQSGEITEYNDLASIPSWVERVVPETLIYDQINYYGYYVNGWLNTILSQKDMIKTTDGYSYVSIASEPYLYTGLTSVQSDESTVGIMLVSLKDKDATFYKLTGATESAAMSSAQGQVQQYNYISTFPILLNVYSKPTYFMALKDQEGLVKQYAFVSVENYNIVGIGDTFETAKSNYYEKLKNNNIINNEDIESTEITGVVERINIINNTVYIKLVNNEKIYVFTELSNNEIYLTKENDNVTFNSSSNNDSFNFVNNSI